MTQDVNANANSNANSNASGTDPNADPNPGATDPNAGKPADPNAQAADPNAGKTAEKAEADKNKAQGAPETYEAFKVPQGMTLHDSVLTEFQGVAKELGLPQDKAQLVIDRLAPKIAERQQAHLGELMAETRKGWRDSITADKELGGTNAEATFGTAKRAMDAFFSPDFVKFLEDTGLGDHPEMVRGFVKVGQLVKQDGTHVQGGANNQPDLAKRLYPNSNHAA